MLLNQTAEYAFRAMACLAIHHGEGPVIVADLAERTGIPASYLSKIMRRLVVAGLVDSKRGQHGGFRLLRAPGEIDFTEVLAAVDVDLDVNRCAFGLGSCDTANLCPLHASWVALRQDFQTWAMGHTLGDLAAGGERACASAPGTHGEPA